MIHTLLPSLRADCTWRKDAWRPDRRATSARKGPPPRARSRPQWRTKHLGWREKTTPAQMPDLSTRLSTADKLSKIGLTLGPLARKPATPSRGAFWRRTAGNGTVGQRLGYRVRSRHYRAYVHRMQGLKKAIGQNRSFSVKFGGAISKLFIRSL
jgi:hypothetical protein